MTYDQARCATLSANAFSRVSHAASFALSTVVVSLLLAQLFVTVTTPIV